MSSLTFVVCMCVKNIVTFHNLGALLGRLSPRCSDPHPAVRTAAIDCLYSLLYIQLRYEGTETQSPYQVTLFRREHHFIV